jgi:acylphosphatase
MRVRVRYAGRVQGVGFRATSRWIAGSHGITGWVRNDPDGSVVLEAQGERDAVEAFLGEILRALGQYIRSHDRLAMQAAESEEGFHILR